MNKFFSILQESSQVTNLGLYEFSKSPKDTLYVTPTYHDVRYILDNINAPEENVLWCENLHYDHIGNSIKNIALDNYLFFENSIEVYKTISLSNIQNLYIFSRRSKVYNEWIYDYVGNCKRNNISFIDMLSDLDVKNMNGKKQDAYDLYHNFITDADVKILTPLI